MLTSEMLSGETVKGHFLIEKEEWEELELHITTSKSQFIREYIKRVNRQGDDLDELYAEMINKRKQLHLIELEIEELRDRIAEVEAMSKVRLIE